MPTASHDSKGSHGGSSIVALLAVGLLAIQLMVADGGTPAAPAGQDPTAVAQQVDTLLGEELWEAGRSRPLPLVNDYTFMRRVYFDIVGRPPAPDVIRQFVQDSDPDKRAKIVEQLLQQPEYGENWAGYWRDVIMYRRSENRALLAAGSASDYLARSLNANMGWDEIAREFITARGDVQQEGATAIILAQGGRPEETVAELSRIFLGIQIQCAQCHDHPYDRWKREQFHELAAFFPRVSVRPAPAPVRRTFSVQSIDFAPRRKAMNDRYLGRAEHYMPDLEDPAAEGTRMTPKFFLNNQELPLGTPDGQRRETLADWMTAPNNPWFAKAMVNRLWSELVGAGFYEPVDDMGPDRECIAPRTLDLLANEFIARDFDLKYLFRCITGTEAYQRESRSRDESKSPDFCCSHPQRLRSDQLFRALWSVTDGPAMNRRAVAPRRGPPGLRRDPSQLFAQVFGFDPSDLRQELSGTVPQTLLLMNSPMIDNLFGAERRRGLAELLREFPGDRELIEELYLRTVSRPPERGETQQALRYLRRADNRAQGFEDVLWALINSSEFCHRI